MDLRAQFGLDEAQWKIMQIFHATSIGRIQHALETNQRFVHYTNAETAFKLFSNKQVWFRKSTNMNDFMEVEHGLRCLSEAYRNNREQLKQTLEGMYPGICAKVEKYFDDWLPTYRTGTFIVCVSEHDDSQEKNEDKMGRLSMWRAYGGTTGVAIVMNGGVFHRPVSSDVLKAYSSAVEYLDDKSFNVEFTKLLGRIESEANFLSTIGEENFFSLITNSFRFATVCTKHPGFMEEREWRIIYSPAIEKSQIITENIETISGVPQRVCKLPLIDRPELGLTDLELPKLINRVIVGPCQFPGEVYEALVHVLTEAGVEDAATKVVVSDIPLRHQAQA
jgi:Protein of unknown function (DUF2971)